MSFALAVLINLIAGIVHPLPPDQPKKPQTTEEQK